MGNWYDFIIKPQSNDSQVASFFVGVIRSLVSPMIAMLGNETTNKALKRTSKALDPDDATRDPAEVLDSDLDGIPDHLDHFPSDPNRA